MPLTEMKLIEGAFNQAQEHALAEAAQGAAGGRERS